MIVSANNQLNYANYTELRIEHLRDVIFIPIGEVGQDPQRLQLHGPNVFTVIRESEELRENSENARLHKLFNGWLIHT